MLAMSSDLSRRAHGLGVACSLSWLQKRLFGPTDVLIILWHRCGLCCIGLTTRRPWRHGQLAFVLEFAKW